MEPTGWIKLHRKLLESPIVKSQTALCVAVHCLLRAYWKPGKILWFGKERELNPGQFYTGTDDLALTSSLSRQQVRTALRLLSNVGFLTTESTNKGTIITVVNYEYYQMEINHQPASQPAVNQQLTSSQPATNQQLTTDEEVKKLRIKELKELKTEKHIVQTPSEFGPHVQEIFEKLSTKVTTHRPNHKHGNPEKDKKIIDLMIRIDKRPPERVIELLDWYPIGQPYIPEIFSASSLREKYEKLESAFNRAKSSPTQLPRAEIPRPDATLCAKHVRMSSRLKRWCEREGPDCEYAWTDVCRKLDAFPGVPTKDPPEEST